MQATPFIISSKNNQNKVKNNINPLLSHMFEQSEDAGFNIVEVSDEEDDLTIIYGPVPVSILKPNVAKNSLLSTNTHLNVGYVLNIDDDNASGLGQSRISETDECLTTNDTNKEFASSISLDDCLETTSNQDCIKKVLYSRSRRKSKTQNLANEKGFCINSSHTNFRKINGRWVRSNKNFCFTQSTEKKTCKIKRKVHYQTNKDTVTPNSLDNCMETTPNHDCIKTKFTQEHAVSEDFGFVCTDAFLREMAERWHKSNRNLYYTQATLKKTCRIRRCVRFQKHENNKEKVERIYPKTIKKKRKKREMLTAAPPLPTAMTTRLQSSF